MISLNIPSLIRNCKVSRDRKKGKDDDLKVLFEVRTFKPTDRQKESCGGPKRKEKNERPIARKYK